MVPLATDLKRKFSDEIERDLMRRELQELQSIDPSQVERVMAQLSAVASRLATVLV
jgi:hypothetical protein